MKRYSIVATHRFDHRLAEIEDFLAIRSERKAISVVAEIMRAVEKLKTLPRRGRMIPEVLDDNYRELIVLREYRLMYRVDDVNMRVIVQTVISGRRPFPLEDIADDAA